MSGTCDVKNGTDETFRDVKYKRDHIERSRLHVWTQLRPGTHLIVVKWKSSLPLQGAVLHSHI